MVVTINRVKALPGYRLWPWPVGNDRDPTRDVDTGDEADFYARVALDGRVTRPDRSTARTT